MNAAGLLAVRISGKEERKRFVCGSAADDEVAAAAEAHGEAGAAAEVAQGHFGAGLLALAQEGQVQGGGGLVLTP